MKTHEELSRMTMKELRGYAKKIGCCLGYDGSRKASAVDAIETQQRQRELDRRMEAECREAFGADGVGGVGGAAGVTALVEDGEGDGGRPER